MRASVQERLSECVHVCVPACVSSCANCFRPPWSPAGSPRRVWVQRCQGVLPEVPVCSALLSTNREAIDRLRFVVS